MVQAEAEAEAQRRLPHADGVLALALAGVGMLGTAFSDTPGAVPTDPWAFVLVLTAAAALALRRRWTLFTLAAVTVTTSTYLVVGYAYGPILFSFFIAVYTLARWMDLPRAAPAAGIALLVLMAHVLRDSAGRSVWSDLIPGIAWVAVPFAIGLSVRLEQQSRAHNRAELVRKQVHQERMRVAQEVHDVVGHGLAAIKMQADVALHVLDRRPEHAERALRAISSSSAAALDELRTTLAGVRDPADSRAATPGLARLPDLEERAAQAGLRVRVETSGEPRHIPAAVDVAAYRIVQEAVTNALRHSGAQAATVRLDYALDNVNVEVLDPGGDGPILGAGEGTGIAGMRDRVNALGGSFRAGPRPDGGFRVVATLPTGDLR